MRAPWLCLILICCLLATLQVQANESIIEFDSDIRVYESGDIEVTENITVTAEGKQIKRGIYRDIPTQYRDRFGHQVRVGFELLGTQRDGMDEPHHTQFQSNGIRIYIGDKHRQLVPGTYRYTLRYRMTRILGLFAEHDELYWNVTGNGWVFPIERARARVRLPESITTESIDSEAYTGLQGDKGRDYSAEVGWDGVVSFATSRALGPREGLSVVVTWPKGHVQEPTNADKMVFLLEDNLPLTIGLGGLSLLLLYYLWAWLRVGRDPQAGVVIPLYHPPAGYSPASMRYIRRMGYDHKCFAAALINLAVKGYLKIEEDSKKQWTLTQTGRSVEMAAGEAALVRHLFSKGPSITLRQSNHDPIGKAVKAQKRSLKGNYESVYFRRNSVYLVPGILISIALLVAAVLAFHDQEARALAGFMSIWLTGWSVGSYLLTVSAATAWRVALSSGSYLRALGTTLFALPFLGFWFFGVFMLTKGTSLGFLLILLCTVAVNVTFYQLMKAPTLVGRRLLDQIEGFRHYLSVAEAEEHRNKQQLDDLELFERFLPYTLALDVEQAWSERFADSLARVDEEKSHYHPVWYHGSNLNYSSAAVFAAGLGTALSSAIASSSHAPGSTSGSGGGGSSGGGGGGGGGGGW